MRIHKIVIAFILVLSIYDINGQNFNLKLKNMIDYDTIKANHITFYKTSYKNIDSFLTDSNTIIMLYSTWCSGLDSVANHIDLLKKKHVNLQIYLITSDLSKTINENLEYLESKNLKYDVLFLDPLIYKGINWGKRYNNFIKSFCPSFNEEMEAAMNRDQFAFYKKGGVYIYDIYK
jgi:hypothetical protein